MTIMQEKIIYYVKSITNLNSKVDSLSKCFRKDFDSQDLLFNKNSADDWRNIIYRNSLIKMRIILENNFKIIETVGLVAITRYIFELTVWLKLIEKDVNYTLVYQRNLIEDQIQHYEYTLSQLNREISLLKEFGEQEKLDIKQEIKKLTDRSGTKPEEIAAVYSKIGGETDAKAARMFSIYTDKAKIYGYLFQAYLVETVKIPQVEDSIDQLRRELDEFCNEKSKMIIDLLKCKNWKEMAKKVSMADEYEYIYSYTSKLLHCSPGSVVTNQKNLEHDEVVIFLRYILTKVRDIIDLSSKQPEAK